MFFKLCRANLVKAGEAIKKAVLTDGLTEAAIKEMDRGNGVDLTSTMFPEAIIVADSPPTVGMETCCAASAIIHVTLSRSCSYTQRLLMLERLKLL